MLVLFLQIFYTFFKIGLFGFGGGYAMISMIQGEVVTKHGWLDPHEFTDIIAISQMTPGPIGINSATYVGYMSVMQHPDGTMALAVLGSALATFAVVLPSFILMLTVTRMLVKYRTHPLVESVFMGLRPTVVGLVASAALVLMNADNFGSWDTDRYQFVSSVIIFILAFVATYWIKVHPILVIVMAGVAGFVLY
ncbi:MAG TPA: chromate transporter [Candidatus Avibacteroides avistercoris]|uniref:Chromate transporter n=1 Tax=Candidatus Avibacteroides avistercoris TaxID=2840690 RepID=A0A9D2UJK0_9BACT|nr:chromate transporter [Candidatus Avibacteroides avistercoris]